MTPRSIRRAAERKQKKMARKAELLAQSNEHVEATVKTEAQPATPVSESAITSDAKPITPAQLAANRANAQFSTGPRTATGKARSSGNAVKSGLTGRTVLLASEDAAEYAAFIDAYQDDLAPVGQPECELVQAIADADWRLRRVRALEFALYTQGHLQFEQTFDNYPEEVRYSMIQLQTHMTYEKQFRNFNTYEARISRRREKDVAELRRMQAERKAAQPSQETRKPSQPRRELTPPKPLPPNGFEFTNSMFGIPDDPRELANFVFPTLEID